LFDEDSDLGFEVGDPLQVVLFRGCNHCPVSGWVCWPSSVIGPSRLPGQKKTSCDSGRVGGA